MNRIQLRAVRDFAICALALQAGVASAAELKVLSSLAFTNAWRDLKPKFEARGHKLDIILGTSGSITKRVTAARPATQSSPQQQASTG